MISIPYVVNRFVGPFGAGALMAAVPPAGNPATVLILLTLATAFGFVSLPGNDRLVRRILDALS